MTDGLAIRAISIGYGARPPHPRWPGDARIAVSLVLNTRRAARYCVLHGDDALRIGADRRRAAPLPSARNLNVESIFEYGCRVGFWEIMRILREPQASRPRFSPSAWRWSATPQIAEAMAQSGFEVACHGQRWIDYQFVPEDEERAHMARNIEAITRLIGRRPLGWYTGRPGPEHAPARGRKRRLSL